MAAVKSAKSLLRKIIGMHPLTLDELITVVTEIEATLNSRPLVPLDLSSSDGVQAFTPAHFLVGRPLHTLPLRSQTNDKISYLRRWNLCSRLSSEFWPRLSQEYI